MNLRSGDDLEWNASDLLYLVWLKRLFGMSLSVSQGEESALTHPIENCIHLFHIQFSDGVFLYAPTGI